MFELLSGDSCEVLDQVLWIFCRPWSILEVADQEKWATNNDKEDNGQESQRPHVCQDDHVDQEFEKLRGSILTLLIRVILGENSPCPDGKDEVATFEGIRQRNCLLCLVVTLQLLACVPCHEDQGH